MIFWDWDPKLLWYFGIDTLDVRVESGDSNKMNCAVLQQISLIWRKMISMTTSSKPLFYQLGLFLLCFVPGLKEVSGQAWVPLGQDDYQHAAYSAPFNVVMSFDTSGNPVVAFVDVEKGQQVSVRTYVNSEWKFVGNAAFSGGRARDVQVDVDDNNNIYVGYINLDSGKRVFVKKFNGNNWIDVGALPASDVANSLTMDISHNGIPYVGYQDSASRILQVKKFVGANWTGLGSNAGYNSGLMRPVIKVGTNDSVIVSYFSGANFHVRRWNGVSWPVTIINYAGNNIGPDYHSMALDTGNIPYVVWKGELFKVGNGSFTLLGAPNWPDIRSSISFDGSNNAYVAYSGIPQTQGIVWKYNGFNWSIVGDFFRPLYEMPEVVVGVNHLDIPHVFYINYDPYHSHHTGSVRRLNGNAWDYLGDLGVVDLYNSTTSLSLDTSGNPWVAVRSQDLIATPFPITYTYEVRRWDGNNWITPGQPIASQGGALPYMMIKISESNTPYVFFADLSVGGKASVVKLTSSGWNYVGNAGFSNGTAEVEDIEITANEEIFVTYKTSGTHFIRRFDGTTWVDPGNPHSSAFNLLLAKDNFGSIVLGYSNDSRTVVGVEKFNNAAWIPWSTHNISLKLDGFEIDGNNQVYFAGSDGSTFRKLQVVKFDGNNWVQVGTTVDSVSSGYNIDPVAFDLDENGVPYLVYKDWDGDSKAKAKMFDGSSWVFLDSSVSAADVHNLGLAAGHGRLVVAFVGPRLYVKSWGIPLPNSIEQTTTNRQSRSLLVWPNPTVSEITVFIQDHTPNSLLRLINPVDGRVLKTIQSDGDRVAVDMSDVPSGIYLLECRDGRNSSSTMVVKE